MVFGYRQHAGAFESISKDIRPRFELQPELQEIFGVFFTQPFLLQYILMLPVKRKKISI